MPNASAPDGANRGILALSRMAHFCMVAQRDIPIPHPVAVTDITPVSGLRSPGSGFRIRTRDC